jgi:hypothetical protein
MPSSCILLQLGILLALQILGGLALYHVHTKVVPLDAGEAKATANVVRAHCIAWVLNLASCKVLLFD